MGCESGTCGAWRGRYLHAYQDEDSGRRTQSSSQLCLQRKVSADVRESCSNAWTTRRGAGDADSFLLKRYEDYADVSKNSCRDDCLVQRLPPAPRTEDQHIIIKTYIYHDFRL